MAPVMSQLRAEREEIDTIFVNVGRAQGSGDLFTRDQGTAFGINMISHLPFPSKAKMPSWIELSQTLGFDHATLKVKDDPKFPFDPTGDRVGCLSRA